MGTDSPRISDPLDFAWAAGFFDGEGSTIARSTSDRPGYRQLNICVAQSGHEVTPLVLLRFRRVMFDLGTISGPGSDGMYFWRVFGREEVLLVLSLMWPYLGVVKRTQAEQAIALFEEQYTSGAYRQQRARRPVAADLSRVSVVTPTPESIEHAWAAGFLDGEGCFGLNRAKARRRGPPWYRIRVSADQHGTPGVPPEVLTRLRDALGGLGRIDRHSDLDDYKWAAEGREAVLQVLALTGPQLGDVKRDQAESALRRFDAQIRLKGDATHCVRGHPYTRVAMKGGRLRKTCNPCARITARALRAKRGIPPRRFADVTRRYTE